MTSRGKIVVGLESSSAIRPPRCATGAKNVTQKAFQDVEVSQIEGGLYQINYNTMSCMESSASVSKSRHVLDIDNDDFNDTDGTRHRPSPPHRVNIGRQFMSRKVTSMAKARRRIAGDDPEFSPTARKYIVSNHDQIPFSVKTQLEIWLSAFQEELSSHRSRSICYDILLQRVREVSEGFEQPSLFSLVTALILLTQFVPLLGPYGEMVQGIIAEIASAVYLLPSKGVGFTTALDAYGKKTFFDSFREARQLFELHQRRSKKYKSLLQLEANVLQATIGRWSWQVMNATFKAWKALRRQRLRREAYLKRTFERWVKKRLLPHTIQLWRNYSHIKCVMNKEFDEDDTMQRLQALYTMEQNYRGRVSQLETEQRRRQDTLEELQQKIVQLEFTKKESIEKLLMMRELHQDIVHVWADVMHLLFGDAHEMLSKASDGKQTLNLSYDGSLSPVQNRRPSAVEARRMSTAIVGGEVIVGLPSIGETSEASYTTPKKKVAFATANIADTASALRRRAHSKLHKLSPTAVVAFIFRFAHELRENQPIKAEDLPERAMSLIRSVLAPVASYPVKQSDFMLADQQQLGLTMQLLLELFLGGHCSLFLKESCYTKAPLLQSAPGGSKVKELPKGSPRRQVFLDRVPFLTKLFPIRDVTGTDDSMIEASLQVEDVRSGTELMHHLAEVRKKTVVRFADAAQNGEHRRGHRDAQLFMEKFTLFKGATVPQEMIESSLKRFISPKDWKRVVAIYPSEGMSNGIDLVQYLREASDLTGQTVATMLLHIEANLELAGMERIFVAAAQESVQSVMATHKDPFKLLLKTCSELNDVPVEGTSPLFQNKAIVFGGHRLHKNATVRKFSLSIMKFMSTARKLFPATDVSIFESAYRRMEEIRGEADEQGFLVLLLFLTHFHDPNPYVPSAERLKSFLDFASMEVSRI